MNQDQAKHSRNAQTEQVFESEIQRRGIWKWSVEKSPILNLYRDIRKSFYPNRNAFALLDASSLPKHTDAWIRTLVKRSRLWCNERTELARELIAHALDAFETGKTDQEIAQSFGHHKQVVKLIRRSVKRKRPFYWQAYRNSQRAIVSLIVVTIVGYGIMAVRFFSGSTNIQKNYLQELNARHEGFVEHEKAWPLLLQADIVWERHKEVEEKRQIQRATSLEAVHDSGLRHPLRLRPGHPDYENTAKLIKDFEPQLVKIREAAKKPVMGVMLSDRSEHVEIAPGYWTMQPLPYSDDPQKQQPLYMVLLPHLSVTSQFSRVLLFDAYLAAQENDFKRMLENIDASIQMAKLVNTDGFMISHIVAIRIAQAVSELTLELLEDDKVQLPEEMLPELAHLLSSFTPRMEDAIAAEKMMFEDILQRVYTDDGYGRGRITQSGLDMLLHDWHIDPSTEELETEHVRYRNFAGPVEMLRIEDRQTAYANYMNFHDLVLQTLDGGPVSLGLLEYELDRFEAQHQKETSVSASFIPSYSHSIEYLFQYRMIKEAAITSLAIESYRSHTGQLPESLESLRYDYLPTMPIDPFGLDLILSYRVSDTGYCLYSVGVDGDDDRGVSVPKNEFDLMFQHRLRNRYRLSTKNNDHGDSVPRRDDLGRYIYQAQADKDGDWVLIDTKSKTDSNDDSEG